MDRRSFLAGSAAIGITPVIAATAARASTKAKWVVRGSEGFDALSFLGPLSGDPFYRRYYEPQVAEFERRMPAAAMATLKSLKEVAAKANILFSPFLDVRFSAAKDDRIEDLLASIADPDGRLLPAYKASPYWDGDSDWTQFKQFLPLLGSVLVALKDAGFAQFHRAIVNTKADRFDRLRTKLASFDVIQGAEYYTGRKFDPTIEIVLVEFCKPHGIKVIGQRFLSALDWPDEAHIRTAGHEILHPPVDPQGAAFKAALAVLECNPLLTRIVKEHDPKYGYNSLGGLLDEDLTSALDQLIGERFGVARDARERWTKVDDGMHVLSAAFYGLMRADGFARTGGNVERWLLEKASSGQLAPPVLHQSAARVLGRAADELWPLPNAKS